MKLSLNWLKKYVDLPESLTMQKLSYDLTMRTVEVEDTVDLSQKYNHIVVGKILSVQPHPAADRLRVCQVDVGMDAPVQIVCGGVNLEEGHWVVCTLPGSYAIWHGEGEPVLIEEAELRGVSSYGMIAGAAEVGLTSLFPVHEDHEIIDLTTMLSEGEIDLYAGMPIADALGLNDILIEIENKSITNRPDLWGHYGIARELAAIYHVPLKKFVTVDLPSVDHYPVAIEDAARCRRFLAAKFTGVDARKSPLWLQVALMKVDVRPINALVDITNYVMMTTGNPTHAYDADHLKGGIVVRHARDGEKLTLLDASELTLSKDDLVIADEEKAIGLAGIMGGAHDSILDQTSEIVFEAANFEAAGVRKSSQKYAVRTEASTRFEKELDTERAAMALAQMYDLLKRIFPETELVALEDAYPVQTIARVIDVSLAWLNRRLGKKVKAQEVIELLHPLGFEIAANLVEEDTLLHISVPIWRSTGDVSMQDDILEEVARMIGYENFSLNPPEVALTGAVHQPKEDLDRRIREYLAFSCGFQEIFSYPWMKDEYIDASGMSADEALRLGQPPAPNQEKLRMSNVPNMLEAIVKNLRYFEEFSIFEAAEVYQRGEMSPSDPEEKLPIQHHELVGAIVGNDPCTLFYKLKGVLENAGRACQMPAFAFSQQNAPEWADPQAWLNMIADGQTVGAMGLLSNRARHAAGIRYQHAAIFVMNTDLLRPYDSRTNHYEPLPLYPHVLQDLSVLVKEELSWREIENAVSALAANLMFVDEYRGKQIPEGFKSLTLRVELASQEGTLTQNQIQEKMQEILAALNKIGANVREM